MDGVRNGRWGSNVRMGWLFNPWMIYLASPWGRLVAFCEVIVMNSPLRPWWENMTPVHSGDGFIGKESGETGGEVTNLAVQTLPCWGLCIYILYIYIYMRGRNKQWMVSDPPKRVKVIGINLSVTGSSGSYWRHPSRCLYKFFLLQWRQPIKAPEMTVEDDLCIENHQKQ